MIPGMQQCSQLVWSRTKGSEGGQGFLGQGAAFQCWTSYSMTPHTPNKQFPPFFFFFSRAAGTLLFIFFPAFFSFLALTVFGLLAWWGFFSLVSCFAFVIFFCLVGIFVWFFGFFQQNQELLWEQTVPSSTHRPHQCGDGTVAWLWSHPILGRPSMSYARWCQPGVTLPISFPAFCKSAERWEWQVRNRKASFCTL